MATIVPVAPGGGSFGVDGTPDAALVEALRAGSRDAFEELYEQYRSRIYNLALRILQSPEDARDITQDVFVKVYRRLPGSRVTDIQLKPWLYRVAINTCYDHLRRRKVHRDIDDVVTDTRATMVDTFEQAELSHLLEETLGDLSERHRTVLVLKDIHGLRHDEIAGILGISRGATETLLFRARESFRTHYAQLTSELPVAACSVARDAAAGAVGGELRGDERRRVLAHAEHCPTCRKTVSTWGAATVGLALLIHEVPLPAALQGAFPFGGLGAAGAGATGAGAGATGAGASGASAAGSALAGSAGAAAGGAGVTAGSSAGLSLAAGGLITKVSGIAGAKVAALVIAATCTAGGGVAAYETGLLPSVHAGPASTAATAGQDARAGDKADKAAAPGLATAAANGGEGAERSAAARDKHKAKGNDKGKAKSGEHGNSAVAKDKASKGNAGGNGGAQGASTKTKPDKPAKPDKPEKPDTPEKPDKPEKPEKPDKPDKPDKDQSAGSQVVSD